MVRPVKKRKHVPYRLLIGLAVIVLLAGGVGLYYYHVHMRPTAKTTSGIRPVNTPSYTPSTPQDNAENNARKASSNPAATLDNGPTATTNSSLAAQIVSASANNGNIHVGTLVSGASSGTCTLTATQGHSTVTLDTVAVKQDVNSYDCGGGAINEPTSKLNPQSGTWQLKLTVTSGGSSASNSSSVTL